MSFRSDSGEIPQDAVVAFAALGDFSACGYEMTWIGIPLIYHNLSYSVLHLFKQNHYIYRLF
jgi:hypothetical protein